MDRLFAGVVVLVLIALAICTFWLPALLPVAVLAFIGRGLLTVAALARYSKTTSERRS